jgi:hypothetical protein
MLDFLIVSTFLGKNVPLYMDNVCRKESAKLMSQLSQLSFEELEGQR